MTLIIASFLALNTIVILTFLAIAGKPQVVQQPITPSVDEMKSFIFWHLLYLNPKDPRGWAPKTSGLGWTVNFRTKQKALAFIFLILLQIFIACLLAFSV